MMNINKNVYLPKMESNSYSTGAFRTDDNHVMPDFFLIKDDLMLFELHTRRHHLSANSDVKKMILYCL